MQFISFKPVSFGNNLFPEFSRGITLLLSVIFCYCLLTVQVESDLFWEYYEACREYFAFDRNKKYNLKEEIRDYVYVY